MKRLLAIAVVLLALTSPGWAADYYNVKTGGMKVAGASTAGLWTDENCYGTIPAALGQLTTDGDHVALYDDADGETYTLAAEIDFATDVAAGFAGVINFESKSGDKTKCIIDGNDADIKLFDCNKAGVTGATWTGITLQNVTRTTAAVAGFSFTNGTAFTFTDCLLTDFDYTRDAGVGFGVAIYSDDDAGRTITLTRTPVTNCDINAGPGAGRTVIGLIQGGTGTSFVLTASPITGNTITSTGTSEGLLSYQAGLTITGGSLVDCTQSTGAGQAHAAINNRKDTLGTGTTTISGFLADGLTTTTTSGDLRGVGIAVHGPATVSSSIFSDIAAATTFGNLIGSAFVSYGKGDASLSDCQFLRNTGGNGPGIYASQGGSITGTRIWFEDNAALFDGGSVYSGGWGDVNLTYFIIKDCTAGDQGGAVYSHLHTDGTRNKTDNYRHGVIYNCTATGAADGDGFFINDNDANNTFAVNIINSIVSANATWGSGTDEVRSDAETTLNVQYSAVNGGADAVTNEDDFTGSISSNPLFGNPAGGNFKLKPTSPCINTGTAIVGLTTDYLGKAIKGNPEIGAYEYHSAYGRAMRFGYGGWK